MGHVMEERLANIVSPPVEGLGFELVRVKVLGGTRPTIQVMAERPDRTMSVADCARLSRELSAILDVEDPMSGEYFLEVSSPGIDRPLTRLKDFEDFKGFEVKVETKTQIENQRRFRGILKGVKDENIKLETKTGEIELGFEEIEKAKLVLNDELIKAATAKDENEQTTGSSKTE